MMIRRKIKTGTVITKTKYGKADGVILAEEPDIAELTHIRIIDTERNQGHGRKLLRRYIRDVKRRGSRRLRLVIKVDEGMERERLENFYKSEGFVDNIKTGFFEKKL